MKISGGSIISSGLVAGTAAAIALLANGCSGKAIPLSTGGYLGSATSNGDTGTRVDGTDLGNIYTVTQVIPATSGNPYATTAELPFTGPAAPIGQPISNGQTPFYFQYTYPQNNYKLAGSHVVIDTSRDSTDTEGIFVDGVFSGRPPTSLVNTSSPRLEYPIYAGNTAGYTPNTYYIDWAIAHYKQGTRNTFDIDLDNVMAPSPVQTVDLLKDGFLPVVIGDDSMAYQAYLVLTGYTISKTALNCTQSPTYTFQNVYLHNDGNSIGTPAFTGTVVAPYESWTMTPAGFQSVEWYYDSQLPRVDLSNVDVSASSIALIVKRAPGEPSALVVNGQGVAESGFDTTQGSTAVEAWLSGSAQSYWQSWVSAIPATNTATSVTLDLVALFGASELKALVAQGKLNIALAGGLAVVSASNASSARGFQAPVSGPELSINGTYSTQLCDVPDDPGSPLSDAAPLPTGTGDHQSPIVSSAQVSEITSSSAVVQWLTDEGATSQVGYGIGNSDTKTDNDTSLDTFHRVALSGLMAYKVYTVRIYTADGNGNLTVTPALTFQTLR